MTDSLASCLMKGARLLGLSLDRDRAGLFLRYLEVLQRERQNLTAVTSPREVLEKHFLDSLAVATVAPLEPGFSVLDVGSGAGFPGVPLKILVPGIRLTLLEPRARRAFFLENLATALSLDGVVVCRQRAEDFLRVPGNRERFLLVTARAVAPLAVLAEYCLPAVTVGGRWVACKGPEAAREVAAAAGALDLLGGRLVRVRDLVLPFSRAVRNLVVVEKARPTPDAFPRPAGVPARRPLGVSGPAGKKAKDGEYKGHEGGGW